MRRLESTTIQGRSGETYSMNTYPTDMRFNDFIAGVYILFAEEQALYVGHSDNVDMVLQTSKVADTLKDQGLSKIGLVRNGSPTRREAILSDLSKALSPTLASL